MKKLVNHHNQGSKEQPVVQENGLPTAAGMDHQDQTHSRHGHDRTFDFDLLIWKQIKISNKTDESPRIDFMRCQNTKSVSR